MYDPTHPTAMALLRFTALLRSVCAGAPPAPEVADTAEGGGGGGGGGKAAVDAPAEVEWACSVCTLINAPHVRACLACETVRGRETIVLDD